MVAHPTHVAVSTLEPAELVALQALAEPTRAKIVALMGHGEHCVCDVGDMLGVSTALVSHHLRTLRASGILRERRSGRWVYYSLDVERVSALRGALVGLLTPTDDASSPCMCSDCAPSRPAATQPGILGRRSPLPAAL